MNKGFNKEGFTAEVKRVIEGLGEVRTDSEKDTLEIQDLHPLTTEKEVKTEVRWNLRNELMNTTIRVLNSNRTGLKLVTKEEAAVGTGLHCALNGSSP